MYAFAVNFQVGRKIFSFFECQCCGASGSAHSLHVGLQFKVLGVEIGSGYEDSDS